MTAEHFPIIVRIKGRQYKRMYTLQAQLHTNYETVEGNMKKQKVISVC